MLLGGSKVVGVDRRPSRLDMAKRVGQMRILPDFRWIEERHLGALYLIERCPSLSMLQRNLGLSYGI
jgi:threonine dehydrogenase-like Zn-dependent dehydrogenase